MLLTDFITFCKTATSADAIYDVYADDADLCDAIYQEAVFLGVDLDATPEPMRASLEAIGLQHNIAILANW